MRFSPSGFVHIVTVVLVRLP